MSNPFVLWIQLASATALMCLCAYQGKAQWTGPVQNELTIVGGWLFDGTTSELRTNPGIMIRNGRIVAVGSLSEMEFSEGAPVVELDSKATILPGFIDLHAHYNYDFIDQGRVEEVRYTGIIFLANGVTSTWSAGEFYPQRVLDQRDKIDSGEEIGLRLFASGASMGGF